ncbi:hypothetical protein [Streptomyces sp. NPDC056361]|uniref:hypothetical protein n=1 Tax=Streptomyces sp. NPDC056361 TaxID=3345795 RepID=UPI0035E01360
MSDDRSNRTLEDSLRAALSGRTRTAGDPTPGGRRADADVPAPGGVLDGCDVPAPGGEFTRPVAGDAGGTEDAEDVKHDVEASVLAAFRAARDAGLHDSRPTRRRDDWTTAADRRRPRRSLRTVVAMLFASATLGGVAVATGGFPDEVPATLVPDTADPGAASTPTPPPAPTASTPPARPETGTPIYPEGHPPPSPACRRKPPCREPGEDGKPGRGQGRGNGKGDGEYSGEDYGEGIGKGYGAGRGKAVPGGRGPSGRDAGATARSGLPGSRSG